MDISKGDVAEMVEHVVKFRQEMRIKLSHFYVIFLNYHIFKLFCKKVE